MWQWLEENGFLEEHISETQLNQGKRMYRRIYNREYQRQRRKERPVVRISLSQSEYQTLQEAAHAHHRPLSSFLKESTIAYLNQTYLVPDEERLIEFREYLALMRYDIQRISEQLGNEPSSETGEGIYASLLERIEGIESALIKALAHPPLAAKAGTAYDS